MPSRRKTYLLLHLDKHEQKKKKKKKKSKTKQTRTKRFSSVKEQNKEEVKEADTKTVRSTYLCTQTPSFAPQPRCAPASEEGPCTVCTSPGGGAVVATRTTRLHDSRTASCWSEDDWEEVRKRGEQRREGEGTDDHRRMERGEIKGVTGYKKI